GFAEEPQSWLYVGVRRVHFVEGLVVVSHQTRRAGITHDGRLEKEMARSPLRCIKDRRHACVQARIGVEFLKGGCFSADSGVGFFRERQLDVTEYFSIAAHNLYS